MKHPSVEEFDAWRDHPVTKWVMRACEGMAREQEHDWFAKCWNSGEADQEHLTENRTRADAYRALNETEYEGWVEANEQRR